MSIVKIRPFSLDEVSGGLIKMAKVRCENCGKKMKVHTASCEEAPTGKQSGWQWKVALICLLSAGGGAAIKDMAMPTRPKQENHVRGSSSMTLGALLDTPTQDLWRVDIAIMNLSCAEGLPGAENLDIKACLGTLDNWAAQIKKTTSERHFVYDRDPAKFDNSENWWRVAALVSYLNQIVGTHYSHELRALPPPTHKFDTAFYADSSDVFLHGLLSEKKAGTCSSMPVLVVSVGRRMGYPLKLAITNRHQFVRWDDPKTSEKFNVEVTGKAPMKKPDSFYMSWPDAITEAEAKRCGLLTSLTPARELTTFLAIRGLCLWHAGRRAEAQFAFSMSHQIDPLNPRIAQYVVEILNEERMLGGVDGYGAGPSPTDVGVPTQRL